MKETLQQRPDQDPLSDSPFARLSHSLLPKELGRNISHVDVEDVLTATTDRFRTMQFSNDLYAPTSLLSQENGLLYIENRFAINKEPYGLYLLDFDSGTRKIITLDALNTAQPFTVRIDTHPQIDPKQDRFGIYISTPGEPPQQVRLRYASESKQFGSVGQESIDVESLAQEALKRVIESFALTDPHPPSLPGTKRIEPVTWEEFIQNTAGDLLADIELDAQHPDTDARLLHNYLQAMHSAITTLGYSLSVETDPQQFDTLRNKQDELVLKAHVLKKQLGLPTYNPTLRPPQDITPTPAPAD